jgi:CelD/BcsL family acetyltransferase involved in cellulose biosynthesis
MTMLSFETLYSGAALDAIADEWSDLDRRSPSAMPFLAYGWLTAYWKVFGEAGSLRVGCVRDQDGRLVAAAPLRLRRRRGLSVLTPLSAEMADFSDVLLDPTTDGAADALAAGLLGIPGWDVIDLPEVGPGATAWQLTGVWPGQFVSRPASTCLELPVDEPEALLAPLTPKHRQYLRRQARRVAELGVRVALVPTDPESLTRAVGELLDLHARQWAGRPVNTLHLTADFRDHLNAAVRELAPAGRAAMTRYLIDGTVGAVSLFLLTSHTVGGYLYGVDPALKAKLDIGSLMIRSGLDLGRETGATTLALLRGQEQSKLRWQPRARHSRRVVLLRPEAGRGHAAAASGLLWRAGRERLRHSPTVLRAADRLRSRRGAPTD